MELARQLSLRLAEGHNDLPFKRLIYVNIGDPQALGQPPISFFRQVSNRLGVRPKVVSKPGSRATEVRITKLFSAG